MAWNSERKNCGNCRFAKFKDEGYSNWTVTGTTFECMVDKHPDGKFDRWYTDERLHWALWCKSYEEGNPIHIGVEGDIK